MRQLLSMMAGDVQADRVVPPSGVTAQVTLLASVAMAFLAVFALALSFASGRLATSWGQELADSATIRILAPPGEQDAQTAAALRVLETTAGVVSAEKMSNDAQQALLTPWLGTALDLGELPMPRLIAMQLDTGRFDAAGLRLRLAAEVPGAVLDDHGRWREPLVSASKRLRLLGWGATLLIGAVIAAIVTLAAQAALAANAQVIAVLRLVGATDQFIATAFVRRFTQRAAIGAAAGMVLGVVILWLIPTAPPEDAPGLLTSFGFRGAEWLVVILVPLLVAIVALAATATAAQRTLRGLS